MKLEMSNGFLDRISSLKERGSIFSLWNFGLQKLNHKKEILFQSILQITFIKSESPQIKDVVTLHLTKYLRFGESLNWNLLITDSSPTYLIAGIYI